MRCYLTIRLQRCKINNSFGEWTKISAGVPQGSILSPLLFNFFINDIFLLLQKCYQANYADGSTMYSSDKCISAITDSLRHVLSILSKWFYNNFIVLNLEKYLFMLLDVDDYCKPTWYAVIKFLIKTIQEKVLGVTLDNKRNFAAHL